MGKRGPQPGSKPRATKKEPAPKVTDALDIDRVCEMLSVGITLTAIADQHKCSLGSLIAWIASNPEYSLRAREARTAAAKLWDEEATRLIWEAKDSFELNKADRMASHYRWRASKIAPREYGDKVAVTGEDGGPIMSEVKHVVEWKKPDEGLTNGK